MQSVYEGTLEECGQVSAGNLVGNLVGVLPRQFSRLGIAGFEAVRGICGVLDEQCLGPHHQLFIALRVVGVMNLVAP